MIEKIKELSLPVVEKYQKSLVSVEHVKEYGIDIVRITIDDPNTFDIDIDDVAKINEEILDLVNDYLPDGYYLEVTSVGIERELKTDSDLEKALGKYIYLKTYEKLESAFNQKETENLGARMTGYSTSRGSMRKMTSTTPRPKAK